MSSVFANEARPIRINVDISVAKGIRIMLRTSNIKFILVYRIGIFFIKSFFKIFYIDSSLYLLRGFLEGSDI